MGTLGYLKLATDDQILHLFRHPTELKPFLSEPVYPFTRKEEGGDIITIDKSWHGLHFLFTGSVEDRAPLPQAFLFGRQHILVDGTPEATRYAQAWFSEEVETIAAFLEGLTKGQLQKQYDRQKLYNLKIYPFRANTPSEKNAGEDWEYLFSYFKTVKQFFVRAKNEKRGMIIFLH